MSKIIVSLLTVILLSACAAPKFSVQPIKQDSHLDTITIVEDNDTRNIFLDIMQSWCLDSGYQCKTLADGTVHNPDELTLNYVSRWSWDLRPYIADAKIKAYKNRKKVGEVTFKAPNSLNTSKFGEDEKRIETMMELIFGQISEEQANKKLAAGEL